MVSLITSVRKNSDHATYTHVLNVPTAGLSCGAPVAVRPMLFMPQVLSAAYTRQAANYSENVLSALSCCRPSSRWRANNFNQKSQLLARWDGAATARKQSAKAFSNSGCYAEVHSVRAAGSIL